MYPMTWKENLNPKEFGFDSKVERQAKLLILVVRGK
jgi:hypothetical protein